MFLSSAPIYLTSTEPVSVVAAAKMEWRNRGRKHELWVRDMGNDSIKLTGDRKNVGAQLQLVLD